MDRSQAIGLLFCMGFVIVLALLVVVSRLFRSNGQNEVLRIQRERNQIMRDAVEIKRFEALMKYKQQEQPQQPPQLDDLQPSGIVLKKGEKHTYQRQKPPMDNFADDKALEKHQAEQDQRIEKIKKIRRL